MANNKARALTDDEYFKLIDTIKQGFVTADNQNVKPNPRIATVLTLQANLGLRIGDVINLRLSDIIRDGSRHRLNIKEEKTGKSREFTVPGEVLAYIQSYAIDNSIKPRDRLFDLTVRAVQKHLQLAAEHLGWDNVSTHSLRKYFAVSIYNSNGYNVELVRQLLQHSSVAVTQHYLSVSPALVEQALASHIKLPA